MTYEFIKYCEKLYGDYTGKHNRCPDCLILGKDKIYELETEVRLYHNRIPFSESSLSNKIKNFIKCDVIVVDVDGIVVFGSRNA